MLSLGDGITVSTFFLGAFGAFVAYLKHREDVAKKVVDDCSDFVTREICNLQHSYITIEFKRVNDKLDKLLSK